MKTLQNNFTTPEQSKRLLELGIPIESANIVYYHTPDSWYDPYLITENRQIENLKSGKGLPCWSADRLMQIFAICFDPDFIHFDTFADGINFLQQMMDKFETYAENMDFSKLEE